MTDDNFDDVLCSGNTRHERVFVSIIIIIGFHFLRKSSSSVFTSYSSLESNVGAGNIGYIFGVMESFSQMRLYNLVSLGGRVASTTSYVLIECSLCDMT